MFKPKSLFSRIMSIEPIKRQSMVSLIWQVAFTAIGFLSTMYFARAVGATVLGSYYLFLAYFNTISLVTDGGFGGAAIKRISEGEEPDAFFSAFVLLRTVLVVFVIFMLVAFSSYFVDLNREGTLVWLMIALIVSLLNGAILGGIVGRGKIGINSTADFINNVSCIFVQVLAVFLGFGVAGLAGGFVLGMLVGTIVRLRFFDLHFVSFSLSHLKSLSSFSFWSFLVSSGGIVFTYADSIMIGHYMTNADVGVYRVILQFTAFAAFTTSALRGTLLPRVSRWNHIGEIGLIEKSLSRAFTYSFILALPLFVGGALLGDKLLYFFYGAEFSNYTTLMLLFMVQIVNIFDYFFNTYLSAMDQLKELFMFSTVAIGANILLNAMLIPVMGISGAAVATLFSITLNVILARRIIARKISVKVETHSLLNIVKATVLMGTVVAVYRLIVPITSILTVLTPVVLGALVYGAALLILDRTIYNDLKF